MMADATPRADHVLEISRILPARPDAVFRAWTDETALVKWWGPKGHTAHIDRFEPEPGGAYRIEMRAPDGTGHWLHGVFREVSPPERLVMTWVWEQGSVAGHEMLVTVALRAVDAGTELRLTHALLPSESAKSAHNQGWSSTLDHLAEQF